MESKKAIETIELSVMDINFDFANPRKPLNKKKKEELLKSIETFGDFGIIVIDENNSVLAGNQRIKLMQEHFPDRSVLCKKLIGYTDNEKKAINIKDNIHVGEWDVEMLASWTSDFSLDLGFDVPITDPNERITKDMELIRYEKYNYVLIVANNEIDFLNLSRLLDIEGKKVAITNKRKINARAVWYHDIQDQIIEKKK